jgi:integrase
MTSDNMRQRAFRRMLAREAGTDADAPAIAAAARRLCERFAEQLAPLIGDAGVAADESPLITALFRIRLLTAQRGGEVHGAAWSEFDLATGWWTIPAERSKNGLAHRAPLSPQAVRILKAWRETVDDYRGSFRAAAEKARGGLRPARL